MPIKKIITASAGTGKTYRLSLEFLGLIYSYRHYPEFRYDQILVITFTKKATAEIRERIYSHLQTLGNRSHDWIELAINLKEIVLGQAVTDQDSPLSDKESLIFWEAWQHLSAHRDELQVMTIDSYVHSIFRNLIRPARGIDRFEVDREAVDKRIPHLFRELMTPACLDRMKGLLSRHMKPSLDEFSLFFRNLVEGRWLQYLAVISAETSTPDSIADFASRQGEWPAREKHYHDKFIQIFAQLISSFCAFQEASGKSQQSAAIVADNSLKKGFTDLFTTLPDNFRDLPATLSKLLEDDYFARDLLGFMAKEDYFWSGTKIQGKTHPDLVNGWKDLYALARTALADCLVFRLFLPEQKEITDLWKTVLEQYDKLVFRNKSFTHHDIAWLTFEGLHSAQPPLFKAETDSEPNEFYEFISHRTRFILIDEFQDTSILQFRIFKPIIEELLSGIGVLPYGGLIVVGDEKQSIFSWRGGQRELLLNLEHLVQPLMPAEKAALTSSWRSTPLLMRVINGVFRHPRLQNHLEQTNLDWQYPYDVSGLNLKQEAQSSFSFRLQNLSTSAHAEVKAGSQQEFVRTMISPFWHAPDRPIGNVAILARTNNELESIRFLLSEDGIPCEFQSSKSLLEHPVIRAVLFLLRFAAYHDWYDFLAFLRSDIILLQGAPLRQVIDLISEVRKARPEDWLEPDFSAVPAARAAYELAKSLPPQAICQSCQAILQICNIQDRLTQQRDFVNIQKFLDAALEYERSYQSELPELQGFLRYCEDNRKQEFLQQQDVESTAAIQLLTIHKSKGLEFDTVFVWWDLSGHKGFEGFTLNSWVKYGDPGFSSFSNFAFTLHYKKILESSSFSSIMQEDELRAQLEELNTLYVALTRAKCRLFLNAAYKYAKGWDDYWPGGEPVGGLSLPHFVIDSVRQYMDSAAEPQPDGSWLVQGNKVEAAARPAAEKSGQYTLFDRIDLRDILPDQAQPTPEPLSDARPERDWTKSFLLDRDNLKGNIAHFYLAQLKYASREEQEQARILTLRSFGNLMRKEELTALIDRVEGQLAENRDLFDHACDIIHTEYPVFSNGREFRIDRLMLNTTAKTYRIIDYKTGEVYDDQQLTRYNSIIQAKLLPAGYRLEQELKPTFIKL
jgi:ATP-dependent exoDNAse (exonuclease V) beta subunit